MPPDWRAYLLVLTPVGISAVQLCVMFFTSNKNVAMLADLACLVFVSLGVRRFRVEGILAALTGLSVVHALLTSVFFETNSLDLVHQVIYYILYPFLLALAYTQYKTAVYVKMGVLAAICLAAMNLAIFPIELMMRGGIENLVKMNFSGVAYELIAVLLLAITLARIGIREVNGYLSVALIVTTILTFSRGALVISLVALILIWYRQFITFFTVRRFILLAFLVFGFVIFMATSYFDNMNQYWVKRLNFDANNSIVDNFETFLSFNGRNEIWLMGVQHTLEWPYIGTGIGTISKYISDLTFGEYGFSSYHNLTLTVLAERGLFLGALYLLLLLYIMVQLTLKLEGRALIFFSCFLLFAHTTGAELIIHSAHVRNANVTFYLFLLFICLRKRHSSKFIAET